MSIILPIFSQRYVCNKCALLSASSLHEEVIPPGTHFPLLTKLKLKNIQENKKLIIVGICNQFPSRHLQKQLTRSFVIAS